MAHNLLFAHHEVRRSLAMKTAGYVMVISPASLRIHIAMIWLVGHQKIRGNQGHSSLHVKIAWEGMFDIHPMLSSIKTTSRWITRTKKSKHKYKRLCKLTLLTKDGRCWHAYFVTLGQRQAIFLFLFSQTKQTHLSTMVSIFPMNSQEKANRCIPPNYTSSFEQKWKPLINFMWYNKVTVRQTNQFWDQLAVFCTNKCCKFST